ncbi:catalase-like domain-containing protein [Hypoxylon sp. FL1284]|nr:catalase-like domain-containing protein [Hypoxylon sp. FL1284]
MSPPTDPAVAQMSRDILDEMKGIAGPNPGYRPEHAKGLLLDGTFQSTAEAEDFSTAFHLQNREIIPIIARFSNSTGIPDIHDTNSDANPRGLAIRFMRSFKPQRIHTDIITHSVDGFPAATGQDTLAFFNAVRQGDQALTAYLNTHPKASAYVDMEKLTPTSFAREMYYGVNAYKFIGRAPEKEECYVRYRIVPEGGVEYLSRNEIQTKRENFLSEEVLERLETEGIKFSLMAQIAGPGDVVDDCTVRWPDRRQVVKLGEIELHAPSADQVRQQKYIIFDPIPRTEGIEPSADPLLDIRSGAYLFSGQERRQA